MQERFLPQDVLTSRELTVLALMADGLSNAEIAQALVIALPTVKWYARQIFQKLDVTSRAKAVARARELNLLGSPAAAQPKPAATAPHNLPVEHAAFVGRQRERAAISTLLQSTRLVTLTGVGGSGKTRLALKVAWENLIQFTDGVWFVSLAALTEPAQVMKMTARALGVADDSSPERLQDAIKRSFSDKRILLVLDNFEHVLEAAPAVSDLIAGAPRLTVLVTSREVLNLYGEHEYPVPPLAVPRADGSESVAALAAIDSVQLFVQSARAAIPSFELTEANHTTVAQICAQLEGLPLSIELSVARLRMLSPAQLLARLDDRLKMLVGGPQDLPKRQQALRSAIEWSYHLLSAEERALFELLAAFRGGCTFDAIEAVHSSADEDDHWLLLESLIRKNLLEPFEGSDGQMRFRMLETIREYALERLRTRPDYPDICRRRTLHYIGVAEAAEPDLRGGDRQVQLFETLENELGNLTAALEWAFSGGDRSYGARLAGALTWFWWRRGYVSDGLYWLKRGIDQSDASVTDPIRAKLLLGAGIVEWALHNHGPARDDLDAALALYRQSGDKRQTAWTLIFRAVADIGDSQAYPAALALCDEGLALLQRLDDQPGMAQALNIRGELTRVQGDYHQAKQAYQTCMQLARSIGDQSRAQMMLGNLGFIALHDREYAQAMKLFADGLLLAQTLNSKSQMAISLAGIASAWAAQGQWLSSARLMAAAAAINTRLGLHHPPGDKPAIDHHVNLIRSQLSAADFEAAWADGSALSAEAAVQFAWSLLSGTGR